MKKNPKIQKIQENKIHKHILGKLFNIPENNFKNLFQNLEKGFRNSNLEVYSKISRMYFNPHSLLFKN